MKTLLLASAVSLTLVGMANAGDVLRSPRDQANEIARVNGISNDPVLVTSHYLGAGFKAYNTAHSMVASGPVKDINLAGANYLGAAAKSPFRELRGWAYEIAPLIEKRDAGQK